MVSTTGFWKWQFESVLRIKTKAFYDILKFL